MTSFQEEVQKWAIRAFGEAITKDRAERCYRFFEEATELVQAMGMSLEDAHRMVEHVFARDVGNPRQEMGGVMVTFTLLVDGFGDDVSAVGWDELRRIQNTEMMRRIREKNATKLLRGPAR